MVTVLFKTTFLHISLMGKIEVVGILINILWLILLAAVLDTYHRQLRIINTEEALESLMSILDR